jgi:hypothetical protein
MTRTDLCHALTATLSALLVFLAASNSRGDAIAYSTFDKFAAAGVVLNGHAQAVNGFVSTQTGEISQISWWGSRFNAPVGSSLSFHAYDFGVEIYADEGGAPATTPAFIAAADRRITPNHVVRENTPVMRYQLEVATPFRLIAGQQYWLSVYEWEDNDFPFSWKQITPESSGSLLPESYFRQVGANAWQTTSFMSETDFHFEVRLDPEPVPEPGAATLAMVGLAGVQVKRRRRFGALR